MTEQRPVHPLIAAAVAALLAGLAAWLWTTDWRWAVTGALAFVVLGVASTTGKTRKQS